MRNSSSWLLVIVRKGRRSGGALSYQREETGRKSPVGTKNGGQGRVRIQVLQVQVQ